MPNAFEAIYHAALKQDAKVLAVATASNSIDEFQLGHPYHSAACQLAKESNMGAAQWLIDRGANIRYVAYGAAVGGHFDEVDALIRQGVDINFVARGAAVGGHFEKAEALIKQGADINFVARGAAVGGHFDEVDALLIRQGVDIHSVAYGAAVGGHFEKAEALIKQGANINFVARGAAIGGHFEKAEALIRQGADINTVAKGLLYFLGPDHHEETLFARLAPHLIHFSPEMLPKLMGTINTIPQQKVLIKKHLQERILLTSKEVHYYHLSHLQAMIKTDPNCRGLLWMLLVSNLRYDAAPIIPGRGCLLSQVPHVVHHVIFSFLVPPYTQPNDLAQLAIEMKRRSLCARLSPTSIKHRLCYQLSRHTSWNRILSSLFYTPHQEQAERLSTAVQAVETEEELAQLVRQESASLKGTCPNPSTPQAKSPCIDPYHKIIFFWNHKLSYPDASQDPSETAPPSESFASTL